MKSTLMLLVAVMLVLVVSSVSQAVPDGWGPWQVYNAITGVGEVSKTSPTGTNNLHYSGNGNPEKAAFSITTTGALDLDRRYCYSNDEIVDTQTENAGLHEPSTNWICDGTGSIDDGAFTTEYTPGATVESGITIKAKVFDGLGYNTDDTEDTKTWFSTLNTFRVAVELQGTDSHWCYEDDTGSDKVITEYNSISELECEVETTALGMPGEVWADMKQMNKT